jgi:hypothetical protein
MGKRTPLSQIIFAAVLIICLSQVTYAQYYDYSDYSDWEYQISIYSWIVDQEGTVTIRGTSIPVDIILDDFSKLWRRSLNGRIQARYENWLILFDARYIVLRDEGVDIDIVLLDLLGGYRLASFFDVMFGGRYFNTNADLTSEEGEKFSGKKGWFDPVVGARLIIPLTRGLYIITRGDVGGFGVGSKLSWQVLGAIDWRIANFSLAAGYRMWDVDYESGSDESLFRYNVTTKGPGIGFTVHF